MSDLFQSKPIFSFSRRGIPEVIVYGLTAFKVESQTLIGDSADAVVVTRSLLKPWQAMGTGGFQSDDPMWAMTISSHSGQLNHIDQLVNLMHRTGTQESDLVCPRAYPLDPNIAAQLRQSGEKPSRLQHPCAGKHFLMIATAKSEGSNVENYWHDDHPIQKRIQALVGREANEKITWVLDSCGLPVAVMSIRALLNMYERFALDRGEPAMGLKKLWTENPRLIGGSRRLDSDITEFSQGRLIAKEGADGLLVVQSLPQEGHSIASFFVKISSGYNAAHLSLALWCALSARPILPKVFQDLKEYLKSRLEEWAPTDQQLANLLRQDGV
ncbi:MAG: asparaginase [Proteobacteria bacterium]|nr:asparaginase [Pseudomonadota bacterium]